MFWINMQLILIPKTTLITYTVWEKKKNRNSYFVNIVILIPNFT